jgi:hypothetical protein
MQRLWIVDFLQLIGADFATSRFSFTKQTQGLAKLPFN